MKAAIRPSAVSLSPFLSMMALFRLRRSSVAFSISPFASISAALQSIMGALVRLRKAMTAAAEIVLILLYSNLHKADPSPTLKKPPTLPKRDYLVGDGRDGFGGWRWGVAAVAHRRWPGLHGDLLIGGQGRASLD